MAMDEKKARVAEILASDQKRTSLVHSVGVLANDEFYADFSAIDLHHFSLKFPSNHIYMLLVVVDHSSLQNFSDRVIDGISAVFLALKRQWCMIELIVIQDNKVDKQTGDLYENRYLLNIARNMTHGIKEVKNVYTQHQSLLFKTMGSIAKGRLIDVDYPFV
ncbi:hypothetical protein IFM89_009420 [Coptis chinensis]|uniref:Uncharacterized protein n=1 Tax=Coptis chinensis TaxID=261450 RepID=A0A835GXN6_9MAGN|nr:hypothetical protein IFM89_009420 [Coptis chinensis]